MTSIWSLYHLCGFYINMLEQGVLWPLDVYLIYQIAENFTYIIIII